MDAAMKKEELMPFVATALERRSFVATALIEFITIVATVGCLSSFKQIRNISI